MRLAILLLAFLAAAFSHAETLGNVSLRDIPGLEGLKVSAPPIVDGVVEEGEWPAEARREGFTDADTNLASDEFAEFWLTYDEKFIYFAGRVKTDPRRVIDEEYRQNVGIGGNDNFRLYVDPTGDFTNLNGFGTNAAGATSIELSGGRAAKTEWLGEIEANGRKTETGWECEMRIPWSIMNLPAAGSRTMRFNVFWYRSNKQNTYIWHFMNNDDSQWPMWTGVEVPKSSSGRTLKLLPYGTGSWTEGGQSGFDSGLDMKTSLTDQLQAVGTINPDFRNIENSILDLDFSRFERLADENRPFFLEGSQYRRAGSLFAPQRIDRFDAGLNLYGSLNSKSQLAVLTTADFGERQALVASALVQVRPNTGFTMNYVRNDQRGAMNNAGAVSYYDRFGKYQVYSNGFYTDDEVVGKGHRWNAGVSFEDSGFGTSIGYLETSADYFPRLGFAPERDFRSISWGVERQVTPATGPFNTYYYGVGMQTATRLNGDFYRDSMEVETGFVLRNRFGFEVGAEFGKFEDSVDHTYSVEFNYPSGDPYRRIAVDYTVGEFEGIDYSSVEVGWRYRPVRRVQLSMSSQFVDYTDFERQHVFSASWDIGKFESVGGRLVEENGRTNWYLSYRLSGGRGAEYFLIVGDPRADSFANRLAFKMVLPLEIRY